MKRTGAKELAKKLKISGSRALEAIFKADLIGAILDTAKNDGWTHTEIA